MSTIHTNKNRLSSAVLSLFIPVSILASLSLGIALTREGRPVSQNNPEKLRIGVFPVRRLARESDRFLESLGRALRTDLGASGMAEIVPLAWPEELAGSDGPTFETLVNRGKEKGCNGVLALHLQAMSFTTKVVDVPIVGKSTLAEAAFGLSGGLIDVTSGAAVSPVKAESTKRNPRYRGPDANAALASDFGTPYFNDSLLGQAGKEAVRQAVEAVRNGLSGLTPGRSACHAGRPSPGEWDSGRMRSP